MSLVSETTRAVTYDRYGGIDVLAIRSRPLPRLRANEMLLRVRAAALNPKDGLFRAGKYRFMSGWRFPKLTGCDFAGEVLEVGSAVTSVGTGDRVWGVLNEVTYRRGSVAERLVVRATECGRMPATLDFEQACSVPLCGLTALQALRDKAGTRHGDRVLVHGASGGVGVHAIQIARALGAHVDTTSSPRNFDLCRSLGAEQTFDYAGDPALAKRQQYRVVFDAVGNRSFAQARRALSADGVYVTTVPAARFALDLLRQVFSHKRLGLVMIRSNAADLDLLGRWVEAGQLRPVVDHVYALRESRQAFRQLQSRRVRGKLVIRIPEDGAENWTLDD